MDRISIQKNRFGAKGVVYAATALLMVSSLPTLSTSAFSGTFLVPPPAPVKIRTTGGPVEEFQKSQFGKEPGYAARQVEEMESPDEENISLRVGEDRAWKASSRSPASIGPESAKGVTTSDWTTTSMSSADRDPSQELSTGAARNGVQEVAVIAGDLGFFPKTIFVSRDVPVRLFVTGSSKNTLCLMMDSFQVRKQIRSQKIEEITFTPNQPGKYRFYCPVNGMEGTLIVKEFANQT